MIETKKDFAEDIAESIFSIPINGKSFETYISEILTPIKEYKETYDIEDSYVKSISIFDPDIYSRHYFKQELYNNQQEIVKTIIDSSIDKSIILEPRQAGKTTSISTGCSMMMEFDEPVWRQKNPNEPFRIGIFAPKLAQAQIDLSRVRNYCSRNPKSYRLINWNESTNSKIVWHNSAELHSISASEQAEIEGLTFNVIVIEEAQRVSDYVMSEKILPMGGSTGAKIIKIGTVRAVRNHFWKSWHQEDLGYKKITHSWLECGNLIRGGFIESNVNGKLIQLSKYIMDRMPLSIKQTLFPNNPELWTSGDMDESDFRTQYLLEWLETFGLYLSELERQKLIGTHELQTQQIGQQFLVAGLDFAGADSGDPDETAVSIWEVTPDKMKKKVFGITFRGDPVGQLQEIINLLHPINGRFRPRKILADATGIGLFPVAQLRNSGLPLEGIQFGATDPESKLSGLNMNYKNAMYSYFKSELDNSRVKYAKKQNHPIPEQNVDYHKGLGQWWNLEVENTEKINKIIKHPQGDHDDIPCADILGVYASKTERYIIPRNSLNLIKPQLAHSRYR